MPSAAAGSKKVDPKFGFFMSGIDKSNTKAVTTAIATPNAE